MPSIIASVRDLVGHVGGTMPTVPMGHPKGLPQQAFPLVLYLLGVEEAPGETDSEIAQGDISGSDEVGRATVIGCIIDEELCTTRGTQEVQYYTDDDDHLRGRTPREVATQPSSIFATWPRRWQPKWHQQTIEQPVWGVKRHLPAIPFLEAQQVRRPLEVRLSVHLEETIMTIKATLYTATRS